MLKNVHFHEQQRRQLPSAASRLDCHATEIRVPSHLRSKRTEPPGLPLCERSSRGVLHAVGGIIRSVPFFYGAYHP
ncbi:unnamed protein product [Peronospora farinosa]|uniref:Uncharacterized protein n=1 Tax=Peronospora farinosa TaxID=134698 RepID=A0AAV0TN53_9STRA|nr:unnamed protein product [Peronospora farinosa]CAI5724652.1 unnamed protein product [Peronospora farinosa]